LKIKKLPEEIINKIAAGEIVERPSSVLKELIENSLDAGSTKIEISVDKGGKRLISVKDNGEGIHQDDLLLAVERYSTSKLKTEEDLYYINSYGFRGEALSSISAVSKFLIKSRTLDEPIGNELYIEGGKFKHLSETGCPIGTEVVVKDLFFNVPARQKFLKTERTELIHILDVFTKYVLKHTDKHFKITVDGKELYNFYPSTLEERLNLLLNKDIKKDLIPIEYENNLGKITGYISLSNSINKKGYLFINDRPVRNYLITKTIKNIIGDNFFVLFLELPPYFIDQNVHPAKIEVKFKKESQVLNLVKAGIEKNLNPFKKETNPIGFELNQPVSRYNQEESRFEIVGQIEDTFLVAYYNNELYIIDQHVAHERIHFELLMKKYKEEGNIPSQRLLTPIPLSLTPDQIGKLENIKDRLEKLGYKFKITTPNVFLEGTPADISVEAAESALMEILESEDIFVPIEDIISNIACKQSVTAGDRLNYEKAKSLLEEWIKTDNPNLCPHGRPIYYKISMDEIKKAVGRK